ncbi:hypothetical protein PROFUN_04919 [Planoprotostelium fungivorum]|uniref:Uncharacterized protein n=1 Tax=Planoprotostelium fungivorum TaxID=1890364 RepID=A0A2P6NF77_9EUKA|nr:hypothetical protein PROFUN_04919 [Planoprotostelium fungivorum]
MSFSLPAGTSKGGFVVHYDTTRFVNVKNLKVMKTTPLDNINALFKKDMKAQLLLLLLALTCALSKTLLVNTYQGNSTSTACRQNNTVSSARVYPINRCITETLPNGTVTSSVYFLNSTGGFEARNYNASTCTGNFEIDLSITFVLNQCTVAPDTGGNACYLANLSTNYTRVPDANDTVSLTYEGPGCTGAAYQTITYYDGDVVPACDALNLNSSCTTTITSDGRSDLRTVCGNSSYVSFPSFAESFPPANTAATTTTTNSGSTSGGSTNSGSTNSGSTSTGTTQSGKTSSSTTNGASAATFASVVVALSAAFTILF